MRSLLLLVTFSFIILSSLSVKASQQNCENKLDVVIIKDSCIVSKDSLPLVVLATTKDSLPNKELSNKKEIRKKKFVSALFAFPFPFGFMGGHRVMLGTKPWVPIVYIATFGGCFGIVPLIDFIVIISSKDFEQYENNPNIFMWIK